MLEAIGEDRFKSMRRLWTILRRSWPIDPPPLTWSDLRYVFDSQEDHDGKEALQG